MTSTSPQNTPAPNPPIASSATSYASAAGATKKASSTTPVIATGSNPPPVVVGSTAPPPQHGKTPSISPVNGRPPITPAVPTVSAAPAVAHGSSNLNGASADHGRKSSVTISANGPNSYMANGGSGGGAKAGIQFGFSDSPAMAHSTPQPSASAPIPIPGNPRVQSPAHSPSPIPQPSASGGKPQPPSQDAGGFRIGSYGGDGERPVRPGSMSQNSGGALGAQNALHSRRESTHSQHSDMGNHGAQGPRPGFPPQGGRGRGYNHNPQYNPQMGYPPNGGQYPRGPQGRGSMPPQYGGRPGMQPYPNSPQPARGSPALQPAMPNTGTPTMNQAMPIPPAQGYQHQYPPPMAGYPPHNYGGYPQMDHMGRPIPMAFPTYPPQMNPYMNGPPQSPGPAAYAHPYAAGQYQPPQPQPMSRNSSQISERPASSTGQHPTPAVAQGTPQPHNAQPKPPVVSSSPAFVKPRKSAAIVIKNPAGEAVDFTSLKTPSSPAPSIAQSKTPPVVVSSTPPPKPGTPASHARSESASASKTAEQLRNEFKEQVRKTAEAPADSKPKEDEAAAKAAAEQAAAEQAAAEKAAAEKAAAEQAAAEKAAAEKAAAEEAAAEKAAAEKAAAEKAAAEEKAKEEERLKEDERVKAEKKAAEEAKAKADAEAAEAASKRDEKKPEPAEMDDEELDRIIREMEEADARREKEQAERTAKKKAEEEEAKKKSDADKKLSAADNDRKLREMEREMERLEEEREKQREESEAKAAAGKAKSVAELLAEKISDLTVSDTKESDPSTPGGVADKLAQLSIGAGDGASSGTETPASTAGKPTEKRAKPAALNLAPLKTTSVEPPQPSAALQSLKSARFLSVKDDIRYPSGISSPNPALNAAVAKKGKAFQYDSAFLLQFQKVFTEQPSLEFHQQVKSLIGDSDGRPASARAPGTSGRQGSRAGAPAFPAMGSFHTAQPAGKPLPPGTTSEQRFAMSQGAMPRPNINPMASFARPGGAFPGGSQMSRTPSSSANMGMPNSPRQGSRSTRGGSKRGYEGPSDGKAAKTMPLTQGMEIKPIAVSATGWKPISIVNKAAAQVTPGVGYLDPEMVQRKVKAALNKMTPEKFDKIADQILTIAAQSKDETDGRTLRQVIQLTFEKATDESHWASMYAKFCKRMLETMSPEIRDETILDKNGKVVSGGALFRKYLLNRCQEEFERGWKTDLSEIEGGDKKAQEAALLSDEYYTAAAAKRRGLGLVQFIGELYKLGMLTERIMHECVRKLVDYNGVPDEAEIESLSKLLRTIGANLDNTEKGKPMMDAYFQRIQTIIDMPDLPSRLKFMLMDVVDLRRVRWVTKEGSKGPKTLEEIRAEAEAAAAQKAAENARSNQRGPGGGRGPMGRGDSRNFSGYNHHQPVPNQVGMDDLRRLKGNASRAASQTMTLGPTSMFSSRSNSGRRLGPGGSLGRAGEESGASSRTGTPPQPATHQNAFAALANMESENPGSPPSTAASPALSKAVADAAGDGRK